MKKCFIVSLEIYEKLLENKKGDDKNRNKRIDGVFKRTHNSRRLKNKGVKKWDITLIHLEKWILKH